LAALLTLLKAIASSDLKTALEGLCSSENVNVPLHNMCNIFLEDFFFDASKTTSEAVLKESAEEVSNELKRPAKQPSAKRERSS
jgi:hypothetical protein